MEKFVRTPKMHYEEGEVHAFHNLDLDTWSYFEALGLLKDLGYKTHVKLWWESKGSRGRTQWKEVKDDEDAFEVSGYAEKKKCEVHLYVEHSVSVVEATKVTKELTYHNEAGGVSGQGLCNATGHVVGNYVRKEPPNKGKEPVDEDMVQGDTGGNDSDGDASDSSEDSMENIYFDDSEEDRDLGLDDGFSDIEDEMTGEKDDDQPESSTIRIKKKRLKTMKHPVHEAAPSGVTPPSQEADSQTAPIHEAAPVDEDPLEHDGVPNDANTEIFLPENVERIHDMEEEYISDELESGDDSDVDGGERPRYPKFREEDMCKEFRFKLGMEFCSLKQFKDFVLEHSVLNGRQIRYVKNDAVRVRVACSKNCPFTIFVSRVGRTTTYRLKTLVARHTCGRVFGNNNAKAGWVAKVIVNKMRSNNKVPPPTENDVNEPPPTQSSQAAAQPPQTDEAPAVAPRKRGRPRSIATTAAGSQTSRASRGSKGKGVSNKTTQAKKKGKGIESSAQGEQQNTSQAAENPDQNPVHSLYGMMLAWGEAMGSKEKFTDAFKKVGISEDQIGSVEPSPIVQGFQTAAAALSRLQHAASQGSNQGGMQNAAADIGILLHTLGHTAGSTLRTESVQQCVNALHETAEQLNEAQPSPVPNDGGQAIDAVARESQEKGDYVPKAPAT
ncbi:Transposase, MuDR, plant [Sesbania bispinosa]|nr:Transposase, MuDR, plant [Sesbania bispinosa]